MALKDIFNTFKHDTVVVGQLDRYLEKKVNFDNDRAVDVNAPSQAGKCMRANYYMRKQYPADGDIDARTMRIFDNGTHVHIRLQKYMTDMGLLIMDEVPLINDEFHIQGHTDGYLDLGDEVAILEIKSINDQQFQRLKDVKEEHKKQGLIYAYCANSRRIYLRNHYHSIEDFENSESERRIYFEKHYQHMQTGHHYSRQSKIKHEVDLNIISDDILFRTEVPVSRVVFLYEDKNTQDLKEFVVKVDVSTRDILNEVLESYRQLNKYCKENKVPPREGRNKSDSMCRWCSYKDECWVV